MIKKRLPVVVELPVDGEYSVDGGTTWIPLAANTRIDIDSSEMVSDAQDVKVRSANAVTELDPDKVGFRSRIYEYINFKNAKSLTSAHEIFMYTIADRIRLQNIDNVTDISSSFRYAIAESVNVGYAPEATKSDYMFYHANIDAVSQIRLSKPGAFMTNTDWMFYNSNIKILGDVLIEASVVTRAQGMFYGAHIDFFPYIKVITSNSDDGDTGSYRNSRMFRLLDTPYILDGYIGAAPSPGSTPGEREYSIGYDYASTTYALFGYTSVRFCGMTYDIEIPETGQYQTRCWSSSNYLKSPFSVLRMRKYHFIADVDDAISGTKIADKVVDYKKLEDDSAYIEVGNWMEEVDTLGTFNSPNVIGATSIVVKDAYIEFIKDGLSYTSDKIARYYDTTFSNITINNYNADMVFGARNGSRIFKRGSEYTCIKADGTVIGTFTEAAEIVAGETNADGSILYLITATAYDEETNGEQQLTGSIIEYNVNSLTKNSTTNVTLDITSQLVGIYKPYSDSNLQVITREWVDDGTDSGVYVEGDSKVRAEKDGITLKEMSLEAKVNKVFKNYWEDNEFMCVNTETGDIVRCFGK